jgi:hypothetical protein
MKEITLKKQDYDQIKDLALKNYLEKAVTSDNFLCECYTKGVLSYLASKNYIAENGRVYEKTKKES